MTATLFEYPRSAAFGRVPPKGKIYEHARPGPGAKELFVRRVERIVWEFKLSAETVNLKKTPAVPEIQVFGITLRDGELEEEVLRCIDRAIPFPILFELRHDGKVKPVAAYKRPSEADSTQWVLGEYFEAGWTPSDTPRKPLPMALDLEALYARLLMSLTDFPVRSGESLQDRMGRMERIGYKRREVEKCEARLRKEKQFNRKVAINAELRDLKRELDGLAK